MLAHYTPLQLSAVGVVSPHVVILESLQLECACGAAILGSVLAGRAAAAVTLFEAHHAGPACAPHWRLVPRPYLGTTPAPRLTPQVVFASAWWVRTPTP